ncbi:MAG: ABC transporter substrate-binding protein, partial [Actinobacteria bacterium]|nr:ABC transporter substrate-binding protein [Actinomycetota bacterium]
AGSAGSYSNAEAMPVPGEEKAKSVLESIQVNQELAAKVPAGLRKTGLRVTTSVGYPPMEEWGSNGTDIVGVDPAMAHAVARTLGLPMTMQDQEFNAMISGLISGRYDLLLSSMTDNAERRETTTFVDYVQAGNAFLVAKGNPEKIAVPTDLCGKTVAVVESGSSALLAEDFSKTCAAEGKPAYTILKLAGDSEANLSVQSGRSAATITDYPVAVERASDPESAMEAVRIEGDESIWGIGFDNSKKDYALIVQQALQALQADGTYGKILDAWGLGEMAVPAITVNGE